MRNEDIGEKKNFRIAPKNESKNNENLDGMIIIPAYNEGLNILNTILSAIAQQKKIKEGKGKVSHGITVVINNSDMADIKIKQSNFSTYLLLQALEHKFPIKIKNDKDADAKIEEIQNSNVPIHIIDAFSNGNTNEINNVGTARKIGTKYALENIHDDGFIISTDADTILGRDVMQLTKFMFQEGHYSAIQMRMETNLIGATIEEKETNIIWRLAGKLQWLANDQSEIEKSISWMSGGGSAYKKSAFQQIEGYKEIPGAEDTQIGMQISDAGFKILDAHDDDVTNGLFVSTRARMSDRTSTGFGGTIEKWSEKKEPYIEKKVFPVKYYEERNEFLKYITTIYDVLFRAWSEKNEVDKNKKYTDKIENNDKDEELTIKEISSKTEINKFYKDSKAQAIHIFTNLCEKTFALDQKDLFLPNYPEQEEDVKELIDIFSKWDPLKPSSTYHQKLYKQTEKIFEKLYPEISVFEYIDDLENIYSGENNKLVEESYFKALGEDKYNSPKSYREFEKTVFLLMRSCGFDLNQNNDRCKIKTSILYFYNSYFDQIKNTVQALTVYDRMNKILEQENSSASEKILAKSIVLPPEIVFLELQHGYRVCLMNTIGDIYKTFKLSDNKDSLESLKKLGEHLSKDYMDFIEKTYNPIKENFRPDFERNIKILQKALEIEEAKEKAQKDSILS